MTRGRCGSLTLHRMTLSFTTPRRFSPAHKEGRQGRSPRAPGGTSIVKEHEPRRRRLIEACGASPEITAPLRSLRCRSEAYGASPKLRCLVEASEAHRSFGAPPILRRPTEAAESHRSCGAAPKLRSATEDAVSHRICGASPKTRCLSEGSVPHRSCGAPPILRSATEGAAPHRSFGVSPMLRQRSASYERRLKRTKKGGAHEAHPWMNVRTQSWGDRADRPASVAAAP
jgi:hypothetical protein